MKRLLLIIALLLPSVAMAKDWKLDLPVNAQGEPTGKSISLYPPKPHPPYYTVINGRHVFDVPSQGAKTSSNTKYTRTEYNQATGRWQLAETNEALRAYEVIIDSLPCGTKTVIGQIHGADNELVRLYADNASSTCGNIGLWFANDIASATGKEERFILKDASRIPITIKEGERFNYTINPSKHKISVAVMKNGVRYGAVDKIHPAWLTDTLYYKWGNYYQTTTPNLTARVSFGKVK